MDKVRTLMIYHFPKVPLLNIAALRTKPSTPESLGDTSYLNHNKGCSVWREGGSGTPA